MRSVWAADLEEKIACCASNCKPEQEGFTSWIRSLRRGTWATPHPGGEPIRARAQVKICRTGAGATCYCGHSTDVKWITNHQKSCSRVKQPSVCLWRWSLAWYLFLFVLVCMCTVAFTPTKTLSVSCHPIFPIKTNPRKICLEFLMWETVTALAWGLGECKATCR